MRIRMKAYNPVKDTLREWDYSFTEYTEWVARGVNRGYKPFDLGDGYIRFTSNKPGNPVDFTVNVVND